MSSTYEGRPLPRPQDEVYTDQAGIADASSTGSGGRSRVVSPDRASLPRVGLSRHIVSGPTGPLVRIWSAECDGATEFSSIASVNPGIGFARIGGRTAVHLRGPATRATPLSCPSDTEYFGVDFRLGAYLPMFPPTGLVTCRRSSTSGSTTSRPARPTSPSTA